MRDQKTLIWLQMQAFMNESMDIRSPVQGRSHDLKMPQYRFRSPLKCSYFFGNGIIRVLQVSTQIKSIITIYRSLYRQFGSKLAFIQHIWVTLEAEQVLFNKVSMY
jgi:hypothetical protein